MTHWRERFPDEVTCVRCVEVRDAAELDRLLWCEACRQAARKRAGVIGWAAAALFAVLLGGWIWLVIRPDTLGPAVWAACVFAAFWLLSKVAREMVYGIERYGNRKAREAWPPMRERPSAGDRPSREGPAQGEEVP